MKRIHIKSIISIGLLFSILAASCLKDKAYDNGSIQSLQGGNTKVIGFGLNVQSANQYLSVAFDNSNTDTTVQLVPVNLATGGAASQDIHVTVVRNDSLLVGYDTTNDAALIPTTAVTVLNNGVVTIPKGSNTGFLSVSFVPSSIIGQSIGLGFTISKIQESGYVISGNTNNGIVAVNIKNIYDGSYSVTGVVHRDADMSLGGPRTPGQSQDLVTTGLYSIQYTPQWANNSGAIGGIDDLILTVDPVTNLVTFKDSSPLGPIPGYKNYYDPATKTFYLAFVWAGADPSHRSVIDTLVYSGPR